MNFFAPAFGHSLKIPDLSKDYCVGSDSLCRRQLALSVQKLMLLVLLKLKALLKKNEAAVSNYEDLKLH